MTFKMLLGSLFFAIIFSLKGIFFVVLVGSLNTSDEQRPN